ncbi:hypothetical protein GGQ85_001695 [Nitrobacter vulgaris]|uniref:hypothetical protein n=1 Tax=Nitrobacter vulgaris TaxID=29421 RepID=UPI0028586740|nr:hypothetical protein [Nitrobacter vulgaris]MDR6303996.1 hypothetical protein [Nitrobacter vulgaris]
MNKRKDLSHIRTLIKARGQEVPSRQGDKEPSLDPRDAMADIRTLARVALESEDTAVMKRDLEMILLIVEKALPSGPENPSEAIFGA